MTKNEVSEIDLLEDMRDAIVHGIDEHGNIVAAGATPDFGGSSSGEDFYVYVSGTQASLPVYCPLLDIDQRHELSADIAPYVELSFDPMTASMKTFGREVRAGILSWTLVFGEEQGYLIKDTVTYKNESAGMIFRDRLYRIAERLAFNDVVLLIREDAEPNGVYQSNEDGRFYVAAVALHLEWWPEVTL